MFYIITRPDLGPAALVLALKLNFVTQFTYVFALSFVKISIGLFLLRLAPTGYYRKIIWSVIGFVAFYTVGGSGALLAQCKPFAANFDRTIPGSSCYEPLTAKALAFTNSCKFSKTEYHHCVARTDNDSARNLYRLGLRNSSHPSTLDIKDQQQNEIVSARHTLAWIICGQCFDCEDVLSDGLREIWRLSMGRDPSNDMVGDGSECCNHCRIDTLTEALIQIDPWLDVWKISIWEKSLQQSRICPSAQREGKQPIQRFETPKQRC